MFQIKQECQERILLQFYSHFLTKMAIKNFKNMAEKICFR